MKSFTENSAPAPKSDCTLVVMAKAPKPGMVKTRLARNIPVEEVTELYRCFLGDTLALARSVGTAEVAIMCPASDVEELTRLASGLVGVVAQSGDDLASGLTSVFAHFTVLGRQRVVGAGVLEKSRYVAQVEDVGVGLDRVSVVKLEGIVEVIGIGDENQSAKDREGDGNLPA